MRGLRRLPLVERTGPPCCYGDLPPLPPARAVTGWRAAVGLTRRPARDRNRDRDRSQSWGPDRGRSRSHSQSRASRCRHWGWAHPSVTCTSCGSGKSPRARSQPAACAGPPASTAGWGRRARRPTVSGGLVEPLFAPEQPLLRPAPHGASGGRSALFGGRLGKAPRSCQGRVPVRSGREELRRETRRTILTWCLDLLAILWSQ